MVQKLFGFGLGGTGVVAVLFIMGYVLIHSNLNADMGSLAIGAAILLAIIFGGLGGLGIIKRLIG